MKRLHYLQHEAFETPAIILIWANEKGFEISATHLYNNEKLPDMNSIDWLIIMGGSMETNDETIYPWLIQEKEFIRNAIRANKIIIGICLGSQLIASALGSKVYKNQVKEIGWFPIHKTDEGKQNTFFDFIPNPFHVFNWHGDTFDLPTGASCIASTEACKNQLFIYNDKTIGVQFHFEMDEQAIRDIVEHCKDEIVDGKYIQSEETILAYLHYVKPNNKIMFDLLEKLYFLN